MIIRRATLVVAGTTMPEERNAVAPKSVARGAPRSGDRAAVGARQRGMLFGRSHPATGSHLPMEGTALPSAVAPDFTATRMGGALQAVCLVAAPSEGGRPRASPEKPCGAGSQRDAAAHCCAVPAFRFRVASPCGRHCSALRGRDPKRRARNPRSGIDPRRGCDDRTYG